MTTPPSSPPSPASSPPAGDWLIAAEGLSFARDGKSILSNVSVKVATGDFITVVGPNGAGKTTLLRCLLGLQQADAGKAWRRRGLRVGYMPQRAHAGGVAPLSVRRFLTLRFAGNKEDLQEAAAATEIDDILEKPLAVVSGGQFQRVLLARALLQKPNLLALDEPSQNLDVSGELLFYKMLERIYEERKIGILMVSHDLHFVMRATKKVICLFGHVCCEGKPEEITQTPEFAALFGAEMARQMAVYKHQHRGHRHG